MERRKLWLCIGVGLLLLGVVLMAVLLTRENGLRGSGIIFVRGLLKQYAAK